MTLTVEFAVAEPGACPVADASAVTDGAVGSVARASVAAAGPVTEEFTAPAEAPVEDAADVETVGTASGESVYRFERDPAEACVCESIEEIAGPAADVRAQDGTLVVTARVDDLEGVRAVVDRLRERFDGVRVRRLTDLADAADPDSGLAAPDTLTDRQREVIQTAYEMGYFEYPKGANAGEVAEAVGISRSTLAEHLAAAQGKLLASVLDPEGAVTP